MSLYVPAHFVGDAAQARPFIDAYPFATLVTAANGDIHVSHLPLLLDESGAALIGHVARSNPHWGALEAGDSIAIFHGPHAFVSRGWYEHPARNVPTWNYATVHVSGRAQLQAVETNHAALEHLAACFESAGLPDVAPDLMARLPASVVAFHLPIRRVEVKFKMSQNKSAADRAGVIAGLRATGHADALATARWMEKHGPA